MSSIEPGRVVVGIDQDPKGYEKALEFAVLEANRRRVGIRLVHGCAPLAALADLDPAPLLMQQEHEERARSQLKAAENVLRNTLGWDSAVECHVSRGTAVAALLEESGQAGILVLQRRSLSALRRFSLGSTTSTVAAQAGCPVAVLRREHVLDGGNSGVVVGVDSLGHGQHALEVAFQEAAVRKTSLTAVHAWMWAVVPPSYGYVVPTEEEMEAARERARDDLAQAVAGHPERYPDVVVQQRVVQGSVVDALDQASENAELLVVGRHGSRHVGSLALGSVARHCLNSARCPVIVTPASRVGKRSQSMKRAAAESNRG